MKKFLFSLNLPVTLSILHSSFWLAGIVSSQTTAPLVSIRFANPDWNATTSQYCVDVEFLSNTSDIQVFGVNVRFFYDDSILEFAGFDDFQGGYAAVEPNPPHIITSEAGPTLFGFEGPADFVNGAIQLVSTETPLILDTVQWTKLFRVCFDIDDADPNLESFCPSLVWDLEVNPADGGYLVADDGVVITVRNSDPEYDSFYAEENVVQFNWRYVGTGSVPWGEPIEEVCIPLRHQSLLDCTINLPKKINCNSNVNLKSNFNGNPEGVTFFWELNGVGSYIKNGQGTPKIIAHLGDSPTEVILTLTDQNGYKSVCSTSIDCNYSAPPIVRNRSSMDASDSLSTMMLLDESPVYKQQNIGIEAIRVWPNPTTGLISMNINAQKEGMVEVGIYNLIGQEMKREKLNYQAGLSTWMMDLSEMEGGSYVVRMIQGVDVTTKIIVLLR